ncbi:undecaprenyl/decaprenyl-phosphate alpha-N-acetylglucosaminyl 1-phosphate transferase, partial [Streptomyces sp. NPDC057052]
GQDAATGAGVLFALTAVAVADVVLVVLARRTAGRPLLRRGPDHLAHRLRRLGLTPAGVAVAVGAAAFPGVLVGTLVHTGTLGAPAVLWVAGGVLVVVLVLWRVRARVPGQGRGGPETRAGRGARARQDPSPHHRQRPRRQPVSLVQPPRESAESPLRAPRRVASPQVSGSLRVRNG